MIDLSTLPLRMKKLPVVDYRGFGPVPVPAFVAWINEAGEEAVPGAPGATPEFRVMNGRFLVRAIKERLCWVCSAPLGRWLAFPIGPMCTITRTISEPPSHRECAEWSIRNCPFLSNPEFVRDKSNIPKEARPPAGFGIKRNPGVICLWMTREYEVFDDGRRGLLITVGKPEGVSWWREGRAATRDEVEASVASGLPILFNAARTDGRFAVEQLERQLAEARALFPPSWHQPLAAEAR